MLPLSSHIISKVYESFFHTITNSKKIKSLLDPMMWLSYNTIYYKHVPIEFLRRKRYEKSRKNKYATNLLSLFHIKHPAAACAMRWPANCCPKTQGKQWHLGPSTSSTFQELFFTVSLTEFGIRKVFLFSFFLLLLLPFFFFFFEILDLKNHN